MRTVTVNLPVPESRRHLYRWRFFQAAGLRQVRLARGSDFSCLDQLPQELWTVLSCPTQGVRFDARTLALLDTDNDGRLRVPELLAAVRWVCRRLRDPAVLLEDAPALRLEALADTPEGETMRAMARRVLRDIGQPDGATITLDDVARRDDWLAQTPWNGDGIITPETGGTPELRALIETIMAHCGSRLDRCGAPGIGQEEIDRFYAEARAYVAWADAGEQNRSAVLPLGDATATACAALQAVRGKIDDYFTRCRLAAFDARAAGPLNRGETDYGALAVMDLNLRSEAIAPFPLALTAAGRSLPLDGTGINPFWADALARLVREAVSPLLGDAPTELTEAAWQGLKARIAPYEDWMAAKAGTGVEPLGVERLRKILAGDGAAQLAERLQKDLSFAAEVDQLADLEQLIRYHAHLNRLLHNTVNLADFYDVARDAIFRVGSLYVDGRECRLCVAVKDVNSHATLAAAGKIFLAYCDITRPVTKEKQAICAAVTAGFANSLWVGRNAVFYDRDGRDWEAVIVKIVEAPISLKEAFWSPWVKISTMVGDQIRKLLTARQDAMLNATAKQIDATSTTVAVATKPPAGPARMEGAALASSVAAIGIAVGLLGSAVGGLISVISGMPVWKSLVGVLAIFLAVSGPSVVLAWFKLRARDLAPLLNACGWAVNPRIRMTMRLGRALTREAALPPGSELELGDAFAESSRGWIWSLIVLTTAIILLIYWRLGWLPGGWWHGGTVS